MAAAAATSDSDSKESQKAFFEEITRNEPEIIEELLGSGKITDVNIKHGGYSALHLTTLSGQIKIMKILLAQKDINVNINEDLNGGTALHLAASSGRDNAAEMLLARPRIDVNAKDRDGNTPLHLAASNGRDNAAEMLEMLLEHPKINVNVKNEKGNTPLHLAVQNERGDVVEMLLEHPKINVNAKNSIIEYRISSSSIGRRPITREKGEQTPLHLAVENEHNNVIEMLLKNSEIEVNARDMYGHTPLHLAVSGKYIEKVERLWNASGIEVNAKSKKGYMPLDTLFESSGNTAYTFLSAIAEKDYVDLFGKIFDSLKQLQSAAEDPPRSKITDMSFFLAAKNGNAKVVNMMLNQYTPDEQESIVDRPLADGVRTLLHLIVQKGHIEVVEQLLQVSGIDVNAKDRDGNTPLHLAVLGKHEDIVMRLLTRDDIDVNVENSDGNTPLLLALENDHVGSVRALLEKGAKFDAGAHNGRTPLHLAARYGRDQVADLLLSMLDVNVDVDASDNDGNTPLHLAARYGHVNAVAKLLAKGAYVNVENDEGETPLLLAARHGRIQVVMYFLSKLDTDINTRYGGDGNTLLHVAARYGRWRLTGALLRRRDGAADPNAKNNSGETPLYVAARNGHDVVAQELLEVDGINVSSEDALAILFELVAKRGNTRVLSELLQRAPQRIDFNAKDNDGNTPLHVTARNGHVNAVAKLLEKGAGVNVENDEGETPLLLATRNGHGDVVHELLETRDIDVSNEDALAILFELVATRGNVRVLNSLLRLRSRLETRTNNRKLDIDINAEDEDGNTPLSLAARNGNYIAVSRLLELRDINVSSEDAIAILFELVAKRGHRELLSKLFPSTQDSNQLKHIVYYVRDDEDNTLLHVAARNGHQSIISYLLARGADVNAENREGKTPLYLAAENAHGRSVKVLLQADGINVSSENAAKVLSKFDTYRDWTPMYWAHPNFDIDSERVRQFVEERSDAVDIDDANDLLFGTAKRGDVVMLDFLLRSGNVPNVDLNSQDYNGNTPLHWAAYYGRKDMVEYLVRRFNTRLDVKNNDLLTALDLAARQMNSTQLEKYRRIVDELKRETSTLVDNNSLAGNLTQVRQRFRQ